MHILINGTTLRQFSLIISENNVIPISDIQSKDPVLFNAWTFNNTIPGPTMRMTEGDHVQITVYNSDSSKHPHSLHMHSIHSGMMDGVSTFSNGVIIDRHLNEVPIVIECMIAAGVASGNIDQRSAILPVTNGAAMLVPLI